MNRSSQQSAVMPHGIKSATIAVMMFLLFGPVLLAQTDPQPPEARTGAKLEDKTENKADDKVDDKNEKKADDSKKQKTEDPERKFAAQCGIDFDKATRRLLINSISRGWREHTDTTKPPELAGEEELFTVRADPSGKRFVRTVHFSDDFDTYQDDCFDESGKLKFLHYEFRTAWGWGYEEARQYGPAGKLLEKTMRFFDTQNEKTIEEPEQAREVADEMKPQVRKTYGAMPFIHFFDE